MSDATIENLSGSNPPAAAAGAIRPENDYGRQLTPSEIESGAHRDFVGGKWDEMGLLQFEFLKSVGLKPQHRLIDIGCGCLRGGIHFISYLGKGHYYGIDVNPSLLQAGIKELDAIGAAASGKAPNLRVVERFEMTGFGIKFDYALAVSVFTHLSANSITRCLAETRKVLAPGRKFYATIFQAPTPLHLAPITQQPGESVTQFDRDPFHYSFPEIEMLARSAGLSTELIGAWNHPRNQRMVCFTLP